MLFQEICENILCKPEKFSVFWHRFFVKLASAPIGLAVFWQSYKGYWHKIAELGMVMENRIHVVVDSTASIGDDVLKKYANLHKIELKVSLAGREWNDDELPAHALFEEKARAGQNLKTSQPPVGAFAQLFRQLAGEVVALCMPAALSGTYQSALAAARAVDAKRIHVVDTRTVAVGMQQLAKRVLTHGQMGWSTEEILRDLAKAVQKTHTLFVAGSLDYLHKGGRIGGAAKFFGTLLQIKPVLYLDETGTIAVLDKVRTKKRALERLLEEAAKTAPHEYMGVVHVRAEADALELKRRLEETCGDSVSLSEAGAVIAAHTGPGSFAIIYQERFSTAGENR